MSGRIRTLTYVSIQIVKNVLYGVYIMALSCPVGKKLYALLLLIVVTRVTCDNIITLCVFAKSERRGASKYIS